MTDEIIILFLLIEKKALHFFFAFKPKKKVENRRKISTDTRSLEKQYCLRGENKRSLGVDWEKGWNNIFRETEMKWKAQRNMKR